MVSKTLKRTLNFYHVELGESSGQQLNLKELMGNLLRHNQTSTTVEIQEETILLASSDDRDSSILFLDFLGYEKGQEIPIIPNHITQNTDVTLMRARDGELCQSRLCILIEGNRVYTCASKFLTRKIKDTIANFLKTYTIISQDVDINLKHHIPSRKAQLMREHGIKSIQLNAVTPDYPQKKSFLESVISSNKYNEYNKNIKLDAVISVAKKNIMTMQKPMLEAGNNIIIDENVEKYTITLGNEQKFTEDDLFIKKSVSLLRKGTTFDRVEAWRELKVFRDEQNR